jgi:hypothetical protein
MKKFGIRDADGVEERRKRPNETEKQRKKKKKKKKRKIAERREKQKVHTSDPSAPPVTIQTGSSSPRPPEPHCCYVVAVADEKCTAHHCSRGIAGDPAVVYNPATQL